MAPSYYHEVVSLLTRGHTLTAATLVQEHSGLSSAAARRWVEGFLNDHVDPMIRGARNASLPHVVAMPGLMGGEPCIAGTRIPAATVRRYMQIGADESDLMMDYPTLPAGSYQAVRRWVEEGCPGTVRHHAL